MSAEVNEEYGYRFLKDIKVKRDEKEYTLSEVDYKNLNRNDIEDMYLLKIQGKIHHLPGKLEYDIINSILIYIRSSVLRSRVEDVHLGIESYQKHFVRLVSHYGNDTMTMKVIKGVCLR